MSAGLDRLVEDIMKEGRTKAEEIKREGLTQIDDDVSRARADATKEAEEIARNAKTECDAATHRDARDAYATFIHCRVAVVVMTIADLST